MKMISIIIPNYNGEENLKRNLSKVVAAMKNFSRESELIVVDDASTDNSVGLLNFFVGTDLPVCPLIIIQNQQNLGFAESCNIGVQNAKGEIVILLNTDVYPDENFIQPLVDDFTDKNVFAVGCLEKTLNFKDEIIDERGTGKLFFKKGIFQHSAGDLNSDKTDWVCGGSGAFRRDIFLALGGFSKEYKPFYWEDIDLSFRARKKGYILVFEKKSVVFHKHDLGAILQKYSHVQIKNISYQNQLKFTKNHLGLNVFRWLFFIFFLLKEYAYKKNQ